jgi:hypothetical protein
MELWRRVHAAIVLLAVAIAIAFALTCGTRSAEAAACTGSDVPDTHGNCCPITQLQDDGAGGSICVGGPGTSFNPHLTPALRAVALKMSLALGATGGSKSPIIHTNPGGDDAGLSLFMRTGIVPGSVGSGAPAVGGGHLGMYVSPSSNGAMDGFAAGGGLLPGPKAMALRTLPAFWHPARRLA